MIEGAYWGLVAVETPSPPPCDNCGCVGISGHYSTGVGLTLGDPDPNYTGAVVRTANGAWHDPLTCLGSQWVWNETYDGDVDYTTTFNVYDPDTAVLCGRWMVDDNGEIYINSTLVDTNGPLIGDGAGNQFFDWTAFSFSGSGVFTSGSNTITFRAKNLGGGDQGIRVEMCAASDPVDPWWCAECYDPEGDPTLTYQTFQSATGDHPGCSGSYTNGAVSGPYDSEYEASTYCPGWQCYECYNETVGTQYGCFMNESPADCTEVTGSGTDLVEYRRVADCEECGGLGMLGAKKIMTRKTGCCGKKTAKKTVRRNGKKKYT